MNVLQICFAQRLDTKLKSLDFVNFCLLYGHCYEYVNMLEVFEIFHKSCSKLLGALLIIV